MNGFSEFLCARRKELKLTQQNIADRLGISNKAVSKWETGDSFPETAQLAPLADILHCTVDEMLHGALYEQPSVDAIPPQESAPEKNEEERGKATKEDGDKASSRPLKLWQSVCIAAGVFLVLFGIAALLVYVSVKGETEEIGLQGAAIFMAFLSIAVFLFVFAGVSHGVTDRVSEEQKPRARLFTLGMGVSIAIILAAVDIILLSPSAVGLAVMLVVMGLAVAAIILIGVGIARFRLPEEPAEPGERWSGIIMLTATVVFLLCGFLWNLWHPAWVVFPAGGILCGIVSEIEKAIRKDRSGKSGESGENKDKED